jgi:hypothetical protein
MLCICSLPYLELDVSSVEQFTNQDFIQNKKDFLNETDYKNLIEKNGNKWVAGYLQALISVNAEVDAILNKRNQGSSRRQTPHLVRSNLEKYWSHNQSVISFLSLQSSIDNECPPLSL